jgi:hypothetical protein
LVDKRQQVERACEELSPHRGAWTAASTARSRTIRHIRAALFALGRRSVSSLVFGTPGTVTGLPAARPPPRRAEGRAIAGAMTEDEARAALRAFVAISTADGRTAQLRGHWAYLSPPRVPSPPLRSTGVANRALVTPA